MEEGEMLGLAQNYNTKLKTSNRLKQVVDQKLIYFYISYVFGFLIPFTFSVIRRISYNLFVTKRILVVNGRT